MTRRIAMALPRSPRFALVLVLAVFGGCASPVPFTPAPERFQVMPHEEAQRRMSELITRSRDPQVGGIQYAPDFFEYRMLHSNVAQQIYYANIEWIQLWDNNYVYIYGPGNQFLAKFLFWNRQEALDFIDLVELMRARQRGGLLPPPPPPPSGRPPF